MNRLILAPSGVSYLTYVRASWTWNFTYSSCAEGQIQPSWDQLFGTKWIFRLVCYLSENHLQVCYYYYPGQKKQSWICIKSESCDNKDSTLTVHWFRGVTVKRCLKLRQSHVAVTCGSTAESNRVIPRFHKILIHEWFYAQGGSNEVKRVPIPVNQT